ncbi:FAD-binding protein [Acuticoccus sp. M5D2P5]|uniref:FAD-binding and (Fe-S)-binding domain-containing protein n=1 Tax=Acuticoccus kalidii TaxID=2910977 RepID=UPI001F16D62F|nr:FAD-binding and (Fe-S)-binding domain-containing protein [Acuticoccus kalidii]MCF3934745.1 FAD-binding protein [Acuticoccus kalidii]
MTELLRPGLARRLERELQGSAHVDPFTRGRYATDASIYQVMPTAVVLPKTMDDVALTLDIAREEGVPLTARGGGSSQCGQTVNSGLIVDFSRHLNKIISLDIEGRRAVVEPGIVLDELNRALKPHGLWYPIDVSTASRATIGGMAANNSCGARSLRYGIMRDNVLSIDALKADGTPAHFGPLAPGTNDALAHDMLALGTREAEEIAARFPHVSRRVGGYNIDALVPNGAPVNMAHLLVGSEGTLALSTAIEIKLSPLPPKNAALAVCHFPTFRAAMEAPQHIVPLGPTSVELVDATMIGLGRDIPIYRQTLERFVRGAPAALLLVEFAEETDAENARRIEALEEVMAEQGLSFGGGGTREGGVVVVADAGLKANIGEFRRAGLNIMMSMKEAGKPVSFVEDCAVPLDHLADYTERLTAVFERHGTRGTWYAHASVGCLHVRPVLNMKLEQDARTMRAIAEEAFAMVREYKGSHSGEHGDGIVRSEFHESMFGSRIVRAFEDVKDRFDPEGVLNPGRVVHPPRMDDRDLFRYPPSYHAEPREIALDWSAWPGGLGGFQGAVEMCNNNGACRKLSGGAMCPSYRVTRNERDVTRGRANTLRLALSGQLGENALTSDEMMETLSLCVSCKACKRECPTGVDMARMKIEVMAARVKEKGLTAKDRLIAYLPRYAPKAARAGGLLALREAIPGLAALSQSMLGFAKDRSLPRFARDPFRDGEAEAGAVGRPEFVLFADTFNRWFEPDNLRAAVRVLAASGGRVVPLSPPAGERPLCCGRTFLAAGLVDEARAEARRMVCALAPHVAAGRTIVGLEPSCLFTLRDEFAALLPGETDAIASRAKLFEEALVAAVDAGALTPPFAPRQGKAYLHGHCHQKAFGAFSVSEKALRLVPELEVSTIESSCCGMAGAFGYDAKTADISRAMGEAALLPAVRAAEPDAIIVADGTSCRHQIHDGGGREAVHVAAVLARALEGAPT